MRVLKAVFLSILAVIAAGLLAFSGMVLWQFLPRQAQTPEVLQSELIFQEEIPAAEPAETTAPEPVETPVPQETPEAPPTAEPEEPASEDLPGEDISPRAAAEAYLQTMSLDEMLWQLIITTPEAITDVQVATRAGDATKAAIEKYPVGGLCYFAANLEDASQTTLMLQNTQSYAKTGMFLCIDEEGGSVSRAGSNAEMGVAPLAAAAEYGAAGDRDAVFAAGKTLAQELLALGFNVNLAPVADVSDTDGVLGTRAYSSDPLTAGAMVAAMTDGLQRGGMLACLKHFPGYGSVQTDAHQDTCTSDRTLDELQQSDWLPFLAGIEEGALFVMLSHQITADLSPLPASLSPEVVQLLREELHFAGIIVTDSLQMGAITKHYTSGEAAVMAIQAGADMLLMPEDLQGAFDGLKAAVEAGELTQAQIEEHVLRILTVKYGCGILQ